jgi:hypothetical protein
MSLRDIRVGLAAIGVLLAVGFGAASAEETGPNAWCFRPWLQWVPVATEAYTPQISCEERELPQGGDRWSSEVTAAIEAAPEGWSPPDRSQSERTRWGWTHAYDASSGNTLIFGKMKRQDGRSPTGSNAGPDVWLSAECVGAGDLRLSLVSDVAPLHGEHAVIWWTDRAEYRRAETWSTGQLAAESDAFRAWSPFPNQLWAEIRNSSRLYVLVFGERSWRMAEAYVARINQLDVLEQLDYCGQDERANGTP